MSKSLFNKFRLKTYTSFRCITSQLSEEYLSEPKYPEILDVSREAVEKRLKLQKHKKLESLKTVEEKLFAINLDRYYGWKCIILKEGNYPYNFLPFIQHITRTQLKELDRQNFHQAQNVNEEECKEILSKIRPYLKEAILFELKRSRENNENNISDSKAQDEFAKSVVGHLNSILLQSLSSQYPHLLGSMIDYDPRVETFWSVAGFYPSEELIKIREEKKKEEDKKITEEEKNEKVEHWFQYFGSPSLQLRHQFPLPILNTEKIGGFTESDAVQNIPAVNYDPVSTYHLHYERKHGTNIPGFWPGDKNEFGLLSFHHTGYLFNRPDFGDEQEQLKINHAQAILASFAWLHAQACYQGFSTFSELTYPLVTQSVITNGRCFSFYLYQLNTTQFHSEHIETNPRANICFNLPILALYQEIQGNEFIGWNDEVLLPLISCFLNVPKERTDTNMKPFLGTDEKYLADLKEIERREWLHNQFRHMYSNRPRSRLPYEIYDWERIYKIKFQTRPIEARTRPFERDEDPLEERKYFEHMHAYIPRAQRTRRKHWTGWRAKFAKTYYPVL